MGKTQLLHMQFSLLLVMCHSQLLHFWRHLFSINFFHILALLTSFLVVFRFHFLMVSSCHSQALFCLHHTFLLFFVPLVLRQLLCLRLVQLLLFFIHPLLCQFLSCYTCSLHIFPCRFSFSLFVLGISSCHSYCSFFIIPFFFVLLLFFLNFFAFIQFRSSPRKSSHADVFSRLEYLFGHLIWPHCV